MDIKDIREKAQNGMDVKQISKLFLKFVGKTSYPIDMDKILENLNFKVETQTLNDGGLRGYVVKNESDVVNKNKNENGIVVIDETEDEKARRFVLAHELGHYIYDFNKIHVSSYEKNATKNFNEVRVNKFAANFLMPEKKFILQYILYRKNIKKLSRKFGVPTDSIKLRIRELGLA